MSAFAYQADLLPGQRVDVLAGLAAGRNATVFNHSVTSGIKAPVDQIVGATAPDKCYFGPFPVLTPCRDWTALVEQFFAPFVFHGQPASFAGAAAQQSHSNQSASIHRELANRLGVRLEDADDHADRSFVLVRVPRNVPSNTIRLSDPATRPQWDKIIAECREVLDAAHSGVKPGPDGTSVAPDSVRQALDVAENRLGTHVVESLSIGDEAFQVFVYARERFDQVHAAMDKSGWKDAQALGFRYFTSTRFLLYAGTPGLASGDPAFTELRNLLADDTYGLNESLFSLLLNEKAVHTAAGMRTLTCIGADLVPIAELSSTPPGRENQPSTALSVSKLIDEVVTHAAISKFGSESCAPAALSEKDVVGYADLYRPFTTITPPCALWSPQLSLTQPYIELSEFWNTATTDKSAVRHLIVMADVIEVQESIDLSTLESVTLVSRLLITGTRRGTVPTVRLSTAAWEPLQLYCGSLHGACAFEAADDPASRRVLFAETAVAVKPDGNQVAFDGAFGGRYPISQLTGDAKAVAAQWRGSVLETGLEALSLMAAAVLRPQAILSPGLKRTAVESWKCLQWIGGCARQLTDSFTSAGKTPPERVIALYSLTTTLARSVLAPWTPTEQVIPQVPSLRFTAFQDAVTRLLDAADTYAARLGQAQQSLAEYSAARAREFDAKKQEALIRDVAGFLVKQNEALAEKEKDLVERHNAVINKNNEAALVLSQREGQLRTQYQTYLEKLHEAQKAMREAITEEIRRQQLKMVFEFVGGMVGVFSGVVTGTYGFKVAGAAEGMEKTLKKWEAFLKFAETANKLVEARDKLVSSAGKVSDLDSSTPSSFAEPPTDTDWDILLNDSVAKVRPAEDYIKSEAAHFIAAVRNLVAIAKSLNAVLQQKARLQFGDFTESVARKVSERQVERLRALKLDLDKPSGRPGHDYVTDLGGLAAMIQQAQSRTLNRLVEIAMLQDDSMTYHYLSQPSLVTHLDLAEIKTNLAAQQLSAVQALQSYPYPPTDLKKPVEIKVEHVPVADLRSGTGAEITVSPTQNDLLNSLARVRVNSVDVRVEGVSTTKGQCHVQLVSAGAPMTDRGLRRETLTYRMTSRDWHVVYDIAGDRTILGTEPAKEWGELFTKPTPFQRWRVLLPNTPQNEGVSFPSTTTTITLRFDVEAMYSAPTTEPPQAAETTPLGAATEAKDPTHFLSLLRGSSLTDGWDVVSFVSVDRINDLWRQRWKAETDAAFHGERMFVQKIDIPHDQPLPPNLRVEYRLQAKVGPPALKFVADAEQVAEVNIPVLEGSVTTTTYQDGKVLGSSTKQIETTSDRPVLIKTKAGLQQLPGDVDEFHAVHLDPARGVFALENIELDPQVDVGFCSQLVEYFKKQQLEPWLLGSLRFHSDQAYLQPRRFTFRTYTPPPTHHSDWPAILGIHVLTSTTEAPAHGMRQSWPDAAWPVSSDFDAAVYFSADLLWQHEVLPALHALGDATVKVDPNTHQRSGGFTGHTVVGDQVVDLKTGWESGATKPAHPHAKVTFDYEPLSLAFDLDALKLSYDHTWKESFPYQGRHPVVSAGDADVSLTVDWRDIAVSCSFDATSSPHIDPATFDVTFDKLTISPKVEIDYHQATFLGFKINEFKEGIVANAKQALDDKFSKMHIALGAMSLFAVSNLLFPESKTLDPSGVYFPGDLAIVGHVTQQWSPPGAHKE